MLTFFKAQRQFFQAASLALGLSILVSGACKNQSAPGKTGESEKNAPSADSIPIGHYGSISGSEATFGQSTDKGIRLAVEEDNAKGGFKGKPLRVITYDTAGKTQEAGTAVTRLITNDKVVAVLGEVASSLSLAGGRVAQQYNVPMISPSSTNVQVTQIGDRIFRVCFVDSFQGYVVAKFAKENLKAKKIATLFDQGQAYSKGLKDDFHRAWIQMGGVITTEQAYGGGDQDFSAQLTTIRDTQPDAVFLPGYYTDVGNIALQARKLGIKVPLLGGDGWDSDKLAQVAGSALDNSYYSTHYSAEEKRPEVENFVKKYQAKYGQVPDAMAALGYDAANLLFESMNRAASLSAKDLSQAIGQTKGFNGVTGVISIDENRNAKKPAVVLEYKGGKFSYVATIQPPN